MKNVNELIAKFTKDYQNELTDYFKALDETNKRYHYISACIYQRVLKDMGLTKEDIDKIADDLREALRQE